MDVIDWETWIWIMRPHFNNNRVKHNNKISRTLCQNRSLCLSRFESSPASGLSSCNSMNIFWRVLKSKVWFNQNYDYVNRLDCVVNSRHSSCRFRRPEPGLHQLSVGQPGRDSDPTRSAGATRHQLLDGHWSDGWRWPALHEDRRRHPELQGGCSLRAVDQCSFCGSDVGLLYGNLV